MELGTSGTLIISIEGPYKYYYNEVPSSSVNQGLYGVLGS